MRTCPFDIDDNVKSIIPSEDIFKKSLLQRLPRTPGCWDTSESVPFRSRSRAQKRDINVNSIFYIQTRHTVLLCSTLQDNAEDTYVFWK